MNPPTPILALKCPKGMSTEEFMAKIRWPQLATPKIDGIRCQTRGDVPNGPTNLCVARTRSMRSVPNHSIRGLIEKFTQPYLDGELTVGRTFQSCTSGIMSYAGTPTFYYHVFDACIEQDLTYSERVSRLLLMQQQGMLNSWELPLIPRLIGNVSEFYAYETYCLEEGAEGVMLRPPNSPYNVGTSDNRATFRYPYLIAIKNFEDSEAEVIGIEELRRNTNTQSPNHLGHAKRSTHSAGMVPGETMGRLVCRDIHDGREFRCGSGFNNEQRDEVWRSKALFMGRIIKYKYQKHGQKDAPRIPVFLGWRAPEDMS